MYFWLWQLTNSDKMWMYISICLLTGVVKKAEYSMYWTRQSFNVQRLLRTDHFTSLIQPMKVRDRCEQITSLHWSIQRKCHRPLRKFCSLCKGRSSFRIYIPSKRERYRVQVFMLYESDTEHLLNFIIYAGVTIICSNPPNNLPMSFHYYGNPSQIVISLTTNCIINKGYCVTVRKYCTCPEVAEALLFCRTGCYGTLRKKAGLLADISAWKYNKSDVEKREDVTKVKKVKYVSMFLTIRTFKLVDSNKKFVKQEKLFRNQTLSSTTTALWVAPTLLVV